MTIHSNLDDAIYTKDDQEIHTVEYEPCSGRYEWHEEEWHFIPAHADPIEVVEGMIREGHWGHGYRTVEVEGHGIEGTTRVSAYCRSDD